ncbi:MAG: hypothetical protein QME32_08075, partial [Endomicrobiia bacterium]|nr:hypothetical protein [Endomicrobiia bacterium]
HIFILSEIGSFIWERLAGQRSGSASAEITSISCFETSEGSMASRPCAYSSESSNLKKGAVEHPSFSRMSRVY